MVGRIIEYCATHRALVFIFTAFVVVGSFIAVRSVPLDAIPDLSDPQVILWTEWMGRSPDLIEDQVTYPIVSTLLAAPRVQAVRGQSMFGMSFIYVIFQEGTNLYWARSRVLEYMNSIRGRLPEGVNPVIGPDATSVGWVFQYALVDRSGQHDLADLRAFQDFNLRYALSSVPGVAEVASVGGYQRQYQVEVDPAKLHAYGLSLADVTAAIRRSNSDVGGRVIEMTGREYFVRGRGYVKSLDDLRQVALGADRRTGTPIRIGDVANASFGPDIRRGVSELDGEGEAVGGTVVMRTGENALHVIERVKKRLAELKPSFPPGVEVEVVYDRSDLIHRAIDTLRHTLLEEAIVVSLIIFVFLLHLRSTLVPVLSLPVAVGLAFVPMYFLGINSNIMSLGGIAIAIGAMVDAAIVLVENAHKHLESAPPGASRQKVLIEAAQEVGPPIFFSLLIITAAFLPIFALNGQAGRLFKPLAYTKTFSMAFAALVSITLAPALMTLFIRGKIRHEKDHPGVARDDLRLPPVRVGRRSRTRRPRSRSGCGSAVGGADGAQARPRVHAAPERRRPALHAHHVPEHLDRGSQTLPPGAGPHDPWLPRGRSACSARPGAPRPRPIPRRSRWWRRCEAQAAGQWRTLPLHAGTRRGRRRGRSRRCARCGRIAAASDATSWSRS
jgi:Cu(I)/Ag(I) efflux system membrane protein CusA/SilA